MLVDAIFTFKYVLESYNYEVDGFTDPILALKTFSGGLYDLIVIDIRMPTISGFELLLVVFLSPQQILPLTSNRKSRRALGFGGICGRHTHELQACYY
jgi:DNA-binding response OmpR family regulator